jgi:hypothetical protein
LRDIVTGRVGQSLSKAKIIFGGLDRTGVAAFGTKPRSIIFNGFAALPRRRHDGELATKWKANEKMARTFVRAIT